MAAATAPVRPRDRTVRRHLAALAFALALPVTVFVGIVLWRFADAERARLEGLAHSVASAAAHAVDQELAGLVSLIETASLFESLQAGDMRAFHAQAVRIRERTGIDVVLREPSGQQLVNTRRPWGEPLPGVLLDFDAEAVRTRRAAVSGLFTGAVAQAPLFAVGTTVPRDGAARNGEFAYLLSLSVPVERVRLALAEELAASGTPADWTVAVVDRAGLILARNRAHEESVGKVATRDLRDATRDGQHGAWRGVTLDGQAVFGAFARSRLSGWRVAVGVPEDALAAPLRRALFLLGTLGAGLAALAAALALWLGRRIAAPIQALADRAAALERGEAVAPLATPVREVNRVARDLGVASAALAEREAALRGSEARLRAILATVPVGVVIAEAPSGRIVEGNAQAERDRLWRNSQDLLVVIDTQGNFRATSPAVEKVLGWAPEEMLGRTVFDFIHPDDLPSTSGALAHATQADLPSYENRYRHKDGGHRWISWVATPEEGLIYASGRHITAEKEQAEALLQAEERLRQSQKMEAVGQLTGGVAHDFNNLLQVILGSIDLLRRRAAPDVDERTRRSLDGAAEAAKRGAALTARLLAFSRRQALDPEPVDPNKLVAGMSDLLRRSLGEAVRVETVLAGGLWRACVDPNQLENAILNLAVNARDAMPEDGGKLTIETANAYLDERYAREHAEVPPGQYVMVAVSDTGSGMAPEVASRAFEPFFTTKDIGQGTGLGLSQVYGFVKQSGGHVKIYSEPGEGTTVKIYLPRLHEGGGNAVADTRSGTAGVGRVPLPAGAGETVLVVEDEASVRRFTTEALRELGYRVLEADGARAALALLDAHGEGVDLLFTDVVMPEVNGRRLADEALRRRPGLKVLFTTGYSRNAIIHNGVLDPGVQLIGKPFTVEELAMKLRAVLERGG